VAANQAEKGMEMSEKRILILDYSVDRGEAEHIGRWLPGEAQITSLFIDTEESFPDDLNSQGFTHVIHSGSALSIAKQAPFTEKAVSFIQQARDAGVAQMGICYGHQLVCVALVGNQAVRSSPKGLEAGWNRVTFTQRGAELLGINESEVVWQHHFDEVTALPEGSEQLATGAHTNIQAFINPEHRLLGTQFHPEFDREAGNQIFIGDRELLAEHGYDVDALVKKGPSFSTGRVLFGYFTSMV
jgi:GMP synthase (glutamine-hydrolysing)